MSPALKAWWPSRRRWVALLLLAAATHLAAVWALPRLIMARVAAGASASELAGAYFPPPTDHTQRRIVMPSPDLLYATCAIDLRGGKALQVSADPRGAGQQGDHAYWSIALYAANSDNFHVLNDRSAGEQPVRLTIVGEGAGPTPPGAIVSPTSRGLLLMRVLVGDPARDATAAEAARRTLRCETR